LLALKNTIPVWVSYTFSNLSSSKARCDRRVSKAEVDKLLAIESQGLHAAFPRVDIDQGRELMTMDQQPRDEMPS